jgi:hypothetical protein
VSYVGHQRVLSALNTELPPVVLLLGPPSVGKWTMCHRLAEIHNVGMVDRFLCPDGFTAAVARSVLSFVGKAPFGQFKLVQARLDGSTNQALNVLLKTLEEPPVTAKFLLTSAARPLATIASRAQIYRLGLLTDKEVYDILLGHGYSPVAAARASVLGRGQVKVAMSMDSAESSRAAVLQVIRALAAGDRDMFERALKGWDTTTVELLHVWLLERITGRWAHFSEADSFGITTRRALAMFAALNQLPAAQARLGVRAALEPFLTPS